MSPTQTTQNDEKRAALRGGRLTHWTGMPILSRRWNPDDGIPDLSGRVALVTGATAGLGLVTTEHLLKHGIAKVYLAARSESRARSAISDLSVKLGINDADAKNRLVWVPFELTDVTSIDKAVETVLGDTDRLDILVANAGVMASPYELKDGVEVQFWNHLGHFALVDKLLPLMRKTAKEHADSSVRIVNVSSMAHNFAPKPAFDSLESVNKQMKSSWARYGQSKLANILFTRSLKTRLASDKIRVFSLHPGNVNTELTRGPIASSPIIGNALKTLSGWLAMSPLEGAKTQLWAATSPEVDELDLNGEYLVPIASIGVPNGYARNDEYAEQLWTLSDKTIRHIRESKL